MGEGFSYRLARLGRNMGYGFSMHQKKTNHQLIQFKFCHRAYYTPIDRFHAKQTTSLNCDLCDEDIPGTFRHMLWDCQEEVTLILSELLEVDIPLHP